MSHHESLARLVLKVAQALACVLRSSEDGCHHLSSESFHEPDGKFQTQILNTFPITEKFESWKSRRHRLKPVPLKTHAESCRTAHASRSAAAESSSDLPVHRLPAAALPDRFGAQSNPSMNQFPRPVVCSSRLSCSFKFTTMLSALLIAAADPPRQPRMRPLLTRSVAPPWIGPSSGFCLRLQRFRRSVFNDRAAGPGGRCRGCRCRIPARRPAAPARTGISSPRSESRSTSARPPRSFRAEAT